MNKSENKLIAARYAKSLLEINKEGGIDKAGVYRNHKNIEAFYKSLDGHCEERLNTVI